ncbi:oligosaccharide flippase family protein, partial [Clostridium tertium]|uniref:oligosaccharide flippase family protein n=1 Tax=Clostridium tertium TaxID=1559 RepID=UPI00232B65D8
MKKSSVGRGIIILSISNIILKLLSALYMPILSGILTDNGIATYIVSYKVFIFLFSITSLGIQPSITKLVAEQRANGSYKNALKVLKVSKKASLFYGGIVSILFAITSIPLSKIFNSEESVLSFIFLSPAIVIAAVLSTYRGYIQGCNDMILLSISNIIEQLLNVVLSLFFAFYFMKISISWGSAGGTIGTTVGAIGAILYIKYVLNKKNVHKECSNIDSIHKAVLYNHEILKSLLVYSIPFILIIAIQSLGSII